MALLIKNIRELVQVESKPKLKVSGKEMSKLKTIKDAWLYIEGDRISDFGRMKDIPDFSKAWGVKMKVVDAAGRMVFPSFCDSHTHLVYAGSREIEYIDKIRGLSYEEIAERGGGILNSARRLHETPEDELIEQALPRLQEIMMLGTGAVEIKSGYGLTVENELKMLRVIRRLKFMTPIKLVPTFLGAHAVPLEYKGRQSEFVDMVINEMIPQVASEELADYIDVFCERGFFYR